MSSAQPQASASAPPRDSRGTNEERRAKRRSLQASTMGNILEWYEWSAYAVFAPFIAAAMFNSTNPTSALLATLAVFAVGFLMRPLGGIIFGRIADKKGRKFVLITTMLIMAAGGLVIGLMPAYATIGIWSSILLLLARMAQGLAHGGESATANSYIAEIAPREHRGKWSSVVFIAIFAGSVLAYLVGGTITAVLPKETIADWGWRIPFILGTGLALAALYMRRSMEESEVFHHDRPTDLAQENPQPAVRAPRKKIVRSILLMVAMTAGITSAHYTWSSYVSTYAITQEGMSPNGAYWATVWAQLVALVTLPFWGSLSDRVGRKPLLFGFAGLMIILQFPLKNMITNEPWTLFAASAIALVIVAMAGAILSAVLSENFPTSVRTQGIGFAYSVSVAVFGGSAPYLNAQLIEWGIGWASSVYIVVLCFATVIAVALLKETKGVDLKEA